MTPHNETAGSWAASLRRQAAALRDQAAALRRAEEHLAWNSPESEALRRATRQQTTRCETASTTLEAAADALTAHKQALTRHVKAAPVGGPTRADTR